MEECKLKMWCLHFFSLIFIGLFAFETYASSGSIFYEPFDESFEERWIVSEKEAYSGVWNHTKSEGHEDYGLLVTEPGKKYAIMKELTDPVDLNNGIVLQFEARLQNGLECGGAYLKFLRPQECGWTPKSFDNNSPYSIMFGPDRCASTNKVHFIINHKNPVTGQYIEHHLISPPLVPSDKMSHVYTAILKPNNEVVIMIDGVERKTANFMTPEHFYPSLIPPKTVPDPEDRRPSDWDDVKTIFDPNVEKPDDWDEDAPMYIADEDAVKPDGWLDDEPIEIDDPEAMKPEDWDDEEDGEWEVPKITNPKCEDGPGCGEWKRPMKRNPNFKGKWYGPMINNPNYMGVWKAREIPNVAYFEVDRPNLEPVAAVGIEILTMQDGILFDNILIASDEKTAESIRDATWKPKFLVETANQKVEEQADGLKGIRKSVFDVLYKIADLPILGDHKLKVVELIEEAEKKPNVIVGIIVSLAVVIVSPLLKILLVIKKKSVKVNVTPKKDAGKTSSSEVGEHAGAASRKRTTRRDG
ncbi:calnexin homolog isoform X2 [Bidens hawaiensis]|uniref:calnexin homolog isoform X2 n=1 Tax=Bidens hawaiensis TaxID=980011 RepID=UPI00404908CA